MAGPRAVHAVSPGKNGWLLALDSLWLCELLLDVVLELESLLEPDETLVELLLLDELLSLDALESELRLVLDDELSLLWLDDVLLELLLELWLLAELWLLSLLLSDDVLLLELLWDVELLLDEELEDDALDDE